jgi:deoxyuridine 5'-triphosphate nucleotidohydrolase
MFSKWNHESAQNPTLTLPLTLHCLCSMIGYDLFAAHDTTVPKHGKSLVKTDISIAIPINTYARIAPRSGLAVKNFIDTGAGVVDYDYRGPVGESSYPY